MTPKGQMSGNGSGPAVMMMPPHIRATFMPNPPLRHLPIFKKHVLMSDNYVTDEEDGAAAAAVGEKATIPTSFPPKKRGAGISGVSSFLHHFERTSPPARKVNPTPKTIKAEKVKAKKAQNDAALAPLVEAYRREQSECSGEYTNGMNCYNTLFVGRLAYEVTERKLLREMEAFGPVKDIKLVNDKVTGKSRGYAFVEYEHEEDMKKAYRSADGMRLEGRNIVVDVDTSVEIVSSSPLPMMRKIARAPSAPTLNVIAPGMSHVGRPGLGFVGGFGGTGGRFPVLAQRSGSPSLPLSVMHRV